VSRLTDIIIDALGRAGVEIDALTPEAVAPIDEFHIGGRRATQQLAAAARVRSDWRVLDVGSGLGGSARYLSLECGCTVTGIDASADWVELAGWLSRRMGMEGRTAFHCGTALALPFPDESFDLVWTEHVQMNIADKARFYSEIARVLRPGGRLAFHDICHGSGGDVCLPVPWAADPSQNHLLSEAALRRTVESHGFRVRRWWDVSEESLAFFERAVDRLRLHGPPVLSPHLVAGYDPQSVLENQRRNLAEHRIVALMSVLDLDAEAEETTVVVTAEQSSSL
jgi:ubiquinone/menaquinone biosynthesis C-methylase UbiE